MAVTQIADIYSPLTFDRREQERQLELTAFMRSGIMFRDPRLEQQVSAGGNTGEITHLKPITIREPNYSTDDPTVTSTPQKISKWLMKFRTSHVNDSWSTMDMARELALVDPLGGIIDRTAHFFSVDLEKRLINQAMGILANNVADDAGDMVVDVYNDAPGAVAETERINSNSVVDALQTLGDHKNNIGAMAMHSVIKSRLIKQHLIEYVQVAGQDIRIPTYLGMEVIEDDSLVATSGTNRLIYTVIFFGRGAFAYAPIPVIRPSYVDYKPDAGNGSGQETLYVRKHFVLHPLGYSFTDTTVTGQDGYTANYADLQLAVNWDRVWDRKNVNLAFLRVND